MHPGVELVADSNDVVAAGIELAERDERVFGMLGAVAGNNAGAVVDHAAFVGRGVAAEFGRLVGGKVLPEMECKGFVVVDELYAEWLAQRHKSLRAGTV